MKKILIGGLLLAMVTTVSHAEHNYTRKDCEVIRVENGVVTFEDKCGFYWNWEIEENEYFEVGDFVDLKMNDNCSTSYVDDDVITKIIFHD